MEPPEPMTDAITDVMTMAILSCVANAGRPYTATQRLPVRLPEVSLHMKMETFNLLREFAAELPGATPAERALKRITGTTP